jgi:hypothetical protein
MKISPKIIKLLGFSAWFLFVPLCNVLYKIFFWIPEIWRDYIFYLRVPLIAVLFLLSFPYIALKPLQAFLRNIFVMSKWYQVSMGIFSALLVGRSVVIVVNAILENAPTRFDSPVVATMIFPWDYVVSIGLGLPIIFEIIRQTIIEEKWWNEPLKNKEERNSSQSKPKIKTDSLAELCENFKISTQENREFTTRLKKDYDDEIVSKGQLCKGTVIGFLAGIAVFIIDKIFLSILEHFKQSISSAMLAFFDFVSTPLKWFLSPLLKWLFGSLTFKDSGYFYLQDGHWILASGHLAGLSFFIIGLALYVVVGIYFRPDREFTEKRIEAPVLIYIAAFLSVGVPLLSTMAFALDKFRFPVLITAFIFIALSYWVWQIDHSFELEDDNSGWVEKEEDFEDVVSKRLENIRDQYDKQTQTPPDKTLVVVAASGGGIHAAGWTTTVLTGLQKLLGGDFTRSIGLISSVSGGSVGTMFFLSHCNESGCIKNLPLVVRDSVQDGLDTIGWGLIYKDFAGLVGILGLTRWLAKTFHEIIGLINIPWLSKYSSKVQDRGMALEYNWRNSLNSRNLEKDTLSSWRKQIFKGQIPIPVFNTTLVEDGCRLLLSPMTFNVTKDSTIIDSNTLYEKYTLKAVTAARLSATFPYVSPSALSSKKITGHNYHIIDGGYFDNSGVVTAIEWLNDYIDPLVKKVKIERLVFIEIGAFEAEDKKPDTSGSWTMALLGPLKALLSVRNASLVMRNKQEINLLLELWRSKLDQDKPTASNVQHLRFDFPSNKSEYKQPLSWKLTASQKCKLELAWQGILNSQDPRKLDGLKNPKDPQKLDTKDLQKIWHENWGFHRPGNTEADNSSTIS